VAGLRPMRQALPERRILAPPTSHVCERSGVVLSCHPWFSACGLPTGRHRCARGHPRQASTRARCCSHEVMANDTDRQMGLLFRASWPKQGMRASSSSRVIYAFWMKRTASSR